MTMLEHVLSVAYDIILESKATRRDDAIAALQREGCPYPLPVVEAIVDQVLPLVTVDDLNG